MEHDDRDLQRRIADLEAQLEELRSRGAERDAFAQREVELEAEVRGTRERLGARGAGHEPSILDEIHIASPCDAVWEEMVGDDRVRHCKACDKSVFDLSAMTRRDAERLMSEHDLPCVRLYRRRDGKVMTADCPVGRRRLRVRRVIAVSGAAAILAGLALVAGEPAPVVSRGAACGLGVARKAAARAADEARGTARDPFEDRYILGGPRRRPPPKSPTPPAKTPDVPSPRGDKSS